jgi:hypothetical protein
MYYHNQHRSSFIIHLTHAYDTVDFCSSGTFSHAEIPGQNNRYCYRRHHDSELVIYADSGGGGGGGQGGYLFQSSFGRISAHSASPAASITQGLIDSRCIMLLIHLWIFVD